MVFTFFLELRNVILWVVQVLIDILFLLKLREFLFSIGLDNVKLLIRGKKKFLNSLFSNEDT